MNPPTEQLTRDYLNRLSVAAKSRLGFRERRALLDQTRARIEFECGGMAEATSARVRQVLAALGDPIALIEAEHRPASLFLGAPVPAGDPLSGGDPLGGEPLSGGDPLPGGEPLSGGEPELSADPESFGAAGLPNEPDWPTQPELATNAPALSSRMVQFGSAALALARQHKLEATAVVLLGLGGALYPPIWFIGAFTASFSKIWDNRDKWIGIIVPVLAVFVGVTLIVVFGGVRDTLGSYAFEAWLSAGRLWRLAALVGAGYLLWRLRRGRRRPKQPPWKVPRKLG